MATPTVGSDFDPREFFEPANTSNPQPFWLRLGEVGPVVPGCAGDPRQVHLVRRADVDFALHHPEIFSAINQSQHVGSKRPLVPLEIDPPGHARYRRILDPVFAPREVARLEDRVVTLVNELIDQIEERGTCEFRTEMAVPLPSTVFLELMGMPLSDLPMFLAMKDGLLHTHSGDPQEAARTKAGWAERVDLYFESALQERRGHRTTDLMSRLLDAEVAGEKLTEDEILGICMLILTAGLDTVTNSLCCMLAYFAQHPSARQRIVADPSLIPAAVEELLRWENPVAGVVRVAAQDTEIGGCPIAKGTTVGISLAAANLDGEATPGAAGVDLTRHPNRHLAFGGGVHRCLGSHLARMELTVALREWHHRIPDYRMPANTKLTYTPDLRQVDRLPLVFGP